MLVSLLNNSGFRTRQICGFFVSIARVVWFVMAQNFTQFMGGLIGGNTTPSGNTASRLLSVVETRRPPSGNHKLK